MNIVERNTKLGTLYVNRRSLKMALEYNNEIITDQKIINGLFEEKRIPIKAQFEITEKCNFSCYYCYAKSLRGQKDLTTKEVKLVIDKLYEMGIVFLELTGGEVLARKDIVEILEYTYEKQFMVAIFTNVSMLNKEIIDAMKSVYMINTSLLAPTEEKCDELTGNKGSFKQIIEGINLLKKSKINFCVQATLTNENIQLANKYKELEKTLDIKLAYNLDVGPTFEGFDIVKQYSLQNKDVDLLRKILGKEYIDNMKIFINNFKCGIGYSKFAVDSEGNVLPCMKYRVRLGNILKDDFDKIWESQILINIMNDNLKRDYKCNECEKKEYCVYCPGVFKLYKNSDQKCRRAELLDELNKGFYNEAY